MKKKQEPRPRRPTALGYTLGEERGKKTKGKKRRKGKKDPLTIQ